MTVVVAVDGKAGSAEAIRVAARESRYRDSSLIAMTAYRTERATGAPGGHPLGALRTGEDERASAELAPRDTVRGALGADIGSVQFRVVAGPPARAITETARQAAADLIVLAIRPGIQMLPRTVSQAVMRNARRPVLVVPCHPRPTAATHGQA